MKISASNFGLPREEIQFLIDQWIFNARNREILADRLFDETPYEALAEKYGLSTQQVKYIVRVATSTIKSHLP